MLYAIFNLFGGLIGLVLILLVIAALTGNVFFVVKQQHAVIIERLGKFHRIVGAGFHAKIPFIDRKAATVSLRTMKNGFDIDVKTEDNVTIGLEVSAQYHVSYDMGSGPADSGVYKSYYMLQQPVAQMRDFITDALRSSIPVYTLDEVFAKKDDIAKDVNATVSEQMAAYGFTLVSTLITKIALPTDPRDVRNGRGHPGRRAARPARRTRRRMPPAGRSDFAFVRLYGGGPARRTERCRGADPHRTRGAYRRSGLLRSAGPGGRLVLTGGRCGEPFIRAIVTDRHSEMLILPCNGTKLFP